MHLHTFNNSGGAFTGDVANNAGFSWSYQTAMRWSAGSDDQPVITDRRLEVQALFGGQITQPVPAVIDDFGTIVVVA